MLGRLAVVRMAALHGELRLPGVHKLFADIWADSLAMAPYRRATLSTSNPRQPYKSKGFGGDCPSIGCDRRRRHIDSHADALPPRVVGKDGTARLR